MKIPEHNEMLERAVLGCVLCSNASIDKIKGRMLVEDFYIQKNQMLYEAMLKLRDQGKIIDLFTIQSALGNNLQKIGGISYVASLAEDVPTASHIDQYAEAVKTLSVKRQLAQACLKISEGQDLDLEKTLPELTEKLSKLSTESVWDNKPDEDMMSKYYDWYAERVERKKNGYVGLKTGNNWVDKRVVLDRKELVTIAGRPGMGKSTFALNLCTGLAHNKQKVLFLSLEMDPFKNINRAIASTTRSSFSSIENCGVEDIAVPVVEYQEYTKNNLTIMGLRNPTIERIKVVAAGFDVVAIDQLSNVRLPDGAGETKPSKITTLCYDLLSMSQELDQLVIICSQINRMGAKEPQLIHLKDSGGIEEASNKVIFVHRKADSNPETDIICAKNRNGEVGHKVKHMFDWNHMAFRPKKAIQNDDVKALFS